MIALDTNAWIALFLDSPAALADRASAALEGGSVALVPMVVSEVLSQPDFPAGARAVIDTLPLLPIRDGFWLRAGLLRADLIRRRQEPKMVDTLIAQMCIDHNIPLLTADRDFSAFSAAGLRLA